MLAQIAYQGTRLETTTTTRHGWLRQMWYQIRNVVAEMNYASRRTVEAGAPWTSGLR